MLSAQLAPYISWNVQTLLNQVCTLLNRVRTLLSQVRILLNRVRAEFSFLIRPVCLPVTWDWLLPTQVQAHKFNRHQPWPLPPFLPAPAGFAPLPPQGCAPVRRGGGRVGGGGEGEGGVGVGVVGQCRLRCRRRQGCCLGPRTCAWRVVQLQKAQTIKPWYAVLCTIPQQQTSIQASRRVRHNPIGWQA